MARKIRDRDKVIEPRQFVHSMLSCGKEMIYPVCPVCGYTLMKWYNYCARCGQRVKEDDCCGFEEM